MSKTYIKEIRINKFRGLKNITLPIAERITLISGKNATSKSTILGIIAHTFNFKNNYITNKSIENRTIWGEFFISKFSEHFKLSETYDPIYSMNLEGIVFDKHSQQDIVFTQELGDYTKQERQRVVVRYVDSNKQKQDRKITHPVIYLGLKRLFPIVERQNQKAEFDYFSNQANKEEFITLSNRILLKTHQNSSTNMTSTASKFLTSTVAHGNNYDNESVSVGEDNIGQILLALLSFKKLKSEMKNEYQGGILLIDEVENSLFPADHLLLLRVLIEFASEYSLQIVMTSHSPVLMKEVLKLNQDKNKLLYLTNSYGEIELTNWELEQIEADISGVVINKAKTTPKKIDCYVEDEEAKNLLNTLLNRHKIKKHLKIDYIKGFGCSEYIRLIEKMPHIKKNTIIILDGDLKPDKEKTNKLTISKIKHPNALTLPTNLPPDQLLFLILHNLPDNDNYWRNSLMFTKPVFSNAAKEVYSKFLIPSQILSCNEFEKIIDTYRKKQATEQKPGKRVRDIFKDFFKSTTINNVCKSCNPFEYYFFRQSNGKTLKEEFLQELINKLLKQGIILADSKKSCYNTDKLR